MDRELERLRERDRKSVCKIERKMLALKDTAVLYNK